jgi:hypothetical protein
MMLLLYDILLLLLLVVDVTSEQEHTWAAGASAEGGTSVTAQHAPSTLLWCIANLTSTT